MRKDIQYIDGNDKQNAIYSAKKAKVRSKYEFVENEDFKLDLPKRANQKSHGGDRKSSEKVFNLISSDESKKQKKFAELYGITQQTMKTICVWLI